MFKNIRLIERTTICVGEGGEEKEERIEEKVGRYRMEQSLQALRV
jgi:hypothetical protein